MASQTWSVTLTHWKDAIRHWYPHHAVVFSQIEAMSYIFFFFKRMSFISSLFLH